MSDDTPIEIRSDIGQWAMVPLWLVEDASPNAIAVYALLGAKWLNRETKDCWPSHTTISKILGVSVSTVRRSLVELEGMKALVIEPRVDNEGRQSSNRYTLLTVPPDAILNRGVFTREQGEVVTGDGVPCSPMNNEPESIEPESIEPPSAPSSPRSSVVELEGGTTPEESGSSEALTNVTRLAHQDPIVPGAEDVVCSDSYGPSHSTRRHGADAPEAIRLAVPPPADPVAADTQEVPDKLSWDQVMEAKDPDLFVHVERLCALLADLYQELGNKRPNPFQKSWYTSMRLLLTKDGAEETGYTPGQVEAIIRWALNDEFWQTNIRSAPTLRKQFDQLRGKRNADIAKRKRTEGTKDSEDTSWMARSAG